MLSIGLTASAAKKAPHENLYVSDRPNGIAEPIGSQSVHQPKSSKASIYDGGTYHRSQNIARRRLQSPELAVGIFPPGFGRNPRHI
jgi:hypothetical protein